MLVVFGMAAPLSAAEGTAEPGGRVRDFAVQSLPAELSDGRMTTDADGLVYVAAVDENADPASVVVQRYTDKGALDTTWGVSGVFTHVLAAAAEDVAGIAVDTDGEVFVAATAGTSTWVVKLDGAGALDTAFGGGAVDTAIPCAPAHSMTVDSAGDVWVVNLESGDGDCTGSDYRKLDGATGASLLAADADWLPSFALDIESVPGGGVALLATDEGGTATMVTRVTASGAVDSGFGAGGSVQVSGRSVPHWYPEAGELNVQVDGSITAAFHPVDDPVVETCEPVGSECFTAADIEVARVSSSGALVETFGTAGTYLADVNIAGDNSLAGTLDISIGAIAGGHVYVGYNVPAGGLRGRVLALDDTTGQVDIGFRGTGTVPLNYRLVGVRADAAQLVTLGDASSLTLAAFHLANGTGICDGLVTTLLGTEGDDVLDGTSGDDVVYAGPGNDTVNGLAGDDIVCGGDGDDSLDGGDGNDTLRGVEGNDDLAGAGGYDDLFGGTGSDALDGGDNADTLVGDTGNDELRGGKGNDSLNAGEGVDKLWGDDGTDTLDGGNDVDELRGGVGNDTINGLSGDDLMWGDTGNDTLNGSFGADVMNGGTGADKVTGGTGADTLNGGDDADKLIGDSGNDILNGGNGLDGLWGGSGADDLKGNAGADALDGGAGKDSCNGGGGQDSGTACETRISVS
jgi:Ca2+-binding RTX toxin-like protein